MAGRQSSMKYEGMIVIATQDNIIDREMTYGNREQDFCFLDIALNWYAVHVKSRHEFLVEQELRRKGMEAFLPTVKKISQWKDRKKLIESPLFPGYVFVRVLQKSGAFLDVLKTRGVAAFVSLEPGTPARIVPEEIVSLRVLVESGKELDVYPHLQEGARVRIKNGPLGDAEGILSKKGSEYFFQVNVELLGRSVAIKIAPHDIETV